MTSFDSVKDSGERTQFSTGSQRDSQDGKGRFDLIPFYPQERLAQHFENGAAKYDDDNWKKGQPLRQYVNSAMRHLFKMSEGWTDEDHPAAVAWNVYAFMWTKNEIDNGRLPKELDNIPWQDVEEETPLQQFQREFFYALGLNGPITVGGPVDDFFDVKEEEPEPGTRVSVRKVMDAIEGTPLDLTEGGVPTGRTIIFRGPALHEDVVKILDALEDAGYEITHAPRT